MDLRGGLSVRLRAMLSWGSLFFVFFLPEFFLHHARSAPIAIGLVSIDRRRRRLKTDQKEARYHT
eukprot:scaffold2422_cov171-Amphora_coffeaeformis.AAC.2